MNSTFWIRSYKSFSNAFKCLFGGSVVNVLNPKCPFEDFNCKAEVHVDNDYKIYYDAVEGDFKFRYNKHTNSFRNRYYEHATEISKYIWKLKDLGKAFFLKWSIAA